MLVFCGMKEEKKQHIRERKDSLMKRSIFLLFICFTLAAWMVVVPYSAAAQTCIPEGTTISSATLSLYITRDSGNTVNIHRITTPWTELGVTWNNFGSSFDPAIEASFVANALGWKSVDVTALVQAWLDGTYPNYGFLLEQGPPTGFTEAKGSEDPALDLRPELEICYPTSGGITCVTIKRPGLEQDGVADAHIEENNPDNNTGWSPLLRTGQGVYGEKQLLIWFDICTDGNGQCEELGTPGFWKNHPDDWPVDNLTLGAWNYSKSQLLTILNLSVTRDASIILAYQLIAAKLNIASGADPTPVADAILEADGLLDNYAGPLPYHVRPNTSAGQDMVAVAKILDNYNNGYLTGDCALY
jgi:hypothetical protein